MTHRVECDTVLLEVATSKLLALHAYLLVNPKTGEVYVCSWTFLLNC